MYDNKSSPLSPPFPPSSFQLSFSPVPLTPHSTHTNIQLLLLHKSLNNKIPTQSIPHPILTHFLSPFPLHKNTQPILLHSIKDN